MTHRVRSRAPDQRQPRSSVAKPRFLREIRQRPVRRLQPGPRGRLDHLPPKPAGGAGGRAALLQPLALRPSQPLPRPGCARDHHLLEGAAQAERRRRSPPMAIREPVPDPELSSSPAPLRRWRGQPGGVGSLSEPAIPVSRRRPALSPPPSARGPRARRPGTARRRRGRNGHGRRD
jgi:hypothetical protein